MHPDCPVFRRAQRMPCHPMLRNDSRAPHDTPCNARSPVLCHFRMAYRLFQFHLEALRPDQPPRTRSMQRPFLFHADTSGNGSNAQSMVREAPCIALNYKHNGREMRLCRFLSCQRLRLQSRRLTRSPTNLTHHLGSEFWLHCATID